jgi:hypothetical protein
MVANVREMSIRALVIPISAWEKKAGNKNRRLTAPITNPARMIKVDLILCLCMIPILFL